MSTTPEALQQALADLFAPWVQALNLQVERTDADRVTLRLPQSDQPSRVGGMLCGQAMMAAAVRRVLLVDASKFVKVALNVMADLPAFDDVLVAGTLDELHRRARQGALLPLPAVPCAPPAHAAATPQPTPSPWVSPTPAWLRRRNPKPL